MAHKAILKIAEFVEKFSFICFILFNDTLVRISVVLLEVAMKEAAVFCYKMLILF